MKIKKIELNNFKRFTHLSVEDIPETTKLVILVGPNGSGKTSFMEAMNHYYITILRNLFFMLSKLLAKFRFVVIFIILHRLSKR